MKVTSTIANAAAAIVVCTAWRSTVRSFEDGINHVNSAALGGGGDDGYRHSVGRVDSCTDAHGNPCPPRNWLRCVGDDVSTNTDTIRSGPHPQQRASVTPSRSPRLLCGCLGWAR